MAKSLAESLALEGTLFEGLEHRARVPLMLRDIVHRGAVEVTLTFSKQTALNMADDIEFAVQQRPHGVAQDEVPVTDVGMSQEEMGMISKMLRNKAEGLARKHPSDGLFQNAYTAEEIVGFKKRAAEMTALADRIDLLLSPPKSKGA